MLLAMYLSFGVGLVMLVMKMSAYLYTGSAAILSDAAESVVHVAAVGFAVYSMRLSQKPPDASHPYGHEKISFMSVGFEGGMIVLAAFYIIYEAIAEWLTGLHLQNLGIGTLLTALAALINGGLGVYLIWLGKRNRSIILEANGKHVLTDCWTSLGVLVALVLTLTTGWLPWDPIFAILVAVNILFSGISLIRRSVSGLMDQVEPGLQERIDGILRDETRQRDIQYHELKFRNLGNTLWIEMHLLFPGKITIQDAHRMATEIENLLEETLDGSVYVTSHLEAIDDHPQIHPALDETLPGSH